MNEHRHKIVAIVQINNELRKGNLERFFSYLPGNVDDIVIYDDASTDGSFEYASKFTQHLIRGTKNNFVNEWQIKRQLVEKALTLKPDFILHVDADEILTDTNGENLQRVANWVVDKDLDGALLYEHNLWRSSTWRRMDSDFGNVWFLRFWRVRDTLSYTNRQKGLHQSPAPDQIQKFERQNFVSLLHYGFATEKSIAWKYLLYGKLGQRGENLARFIVEEKYLRVEKVDKALYPHGLWQDTEAPIPYPVSKWYKIVEEHRSTVNKPNISIVCLIYQSTGWLQFAYNQILAHTDLSDKELIFIANDATPEVKKYLYDHYIPHYIFENTEEHRQEWYINNVYRAWDFGAEKAQGDFLVFVNSDMAFSPNWLENLLEQYNAKNCVTSRLVERNTIPNDATIIRKNFGDHFTTYKESPFLEFAKKAAQDRKVPGGAFMPLFIKKSDFEAVGGYPEGNMRADSDIHQPIIAKKGEDLVSGDIVLMQKLAERGIVHETALNSLVYHFQEGEMRDVPTQIPANNDVEVVIVNDSFRGIAGEKMFWNFLLEGLPRSAGVDMKLIGADEKNFTQKASTYIKTHYPNARFIIQNATFIDLIRPDLHTITLLQDNLRGMNKISLQQEENLAATHTHIANSIHTAADYPEYVFNITPLGLNEQLFKPGDKKAARQKHQLPNDKRVGIFVGALSPVKGWDKIEPIIKNRTDIHWILVTKDDSLFEASNVSNFAKISQETLAELYQASDFFILGSPMETQCLAALEAGLSNLPIIMPLTGIFADWTESERATCGIFGKDLADSVDKIADGTYSPRKTIISKGLTIPKMIEVWWSTLARLKLIIQDNEPAPTPQYSRLYTLRRKLKFILSKQFFIFTAKRYLSPSAFTLLIAAHRKIKRILL